jgi:hypothetical protein
MLDVVPLLPFLGELEGTADAFGPAALPKNEELGLQTIDFML